MIFFYTLPPSPGPPVHPSPPQGFDLLVDYFLPSIDTSIMTTVTNPLECKVGTEATGLVPEVVSCTLLSGGCADGAYNSFFPSHDDLTIIVTSSTPTSREIPNTRNVPVSSVQAQLRQSYHLQSL
jgi:hypothetical protein